MQRNIECSSRTERATLRFFLVCRSKFAVGLRISLHHCSGSIHHFFGSRELFPWGTQPHYFELFH